MRGGPADRFNTVDCPLPGCLPRRPSAFAALQESRELAASLEHVGSAAMLLPEVGEPKPAHTPIPAGVKHGHSKGAVDPRFELKKAESKTSHADAMMVRADALMAKLNRDDVKEAEEAAKAKVREAEAAKKAKEEAEAKAKAEAEAEKAAREKAAKTPPDQLRNSSLTRLTMMMDKPKTPTTKPAEKSASGGGVGVMRGGRRHKKSAIGSMAQQQKFWFDGVISQVRRLAQCVC